MAVEDASPRVAYIARPCQWFASLPDSCQPSIWTDERYGEQVRQWLLEVIETIAGGHPVRLVGFSGGAHLALQLVSHLENAEGVVSVAGNLNDSLFAQYHRLPAARHVPAERPEVALWSLSGNADRIVPPELTERMLEAREGRCQTHQVLEGAEHGGTWQLDWPRIVAFWESCKGL
ncbi:alpha/beta hydrolase [Halomonas sp. BC04]|uniref:alpha/beta hydrolase n=1 Tax=Halomonas sp. BC04 TaxID=1403540 RepID=UPI0006876405|nr:alpha/beta hydrolase [Halomonas sp. BC04]